MRSLVCKRQVANSSYQGTFCREELEASFVNTVMQLCSIENVFASFYKQHAADDREMAREGGVPFGLPSHIPFLSVTPSLHVAQTHSPRPFRYSGCRSRRNIEKTRPDWVGRFRFRGNQSLIAFGDELEELNLPRKDPDGNPIR